MVVLEHAELRDSAQPSRASEIAMYWPLLALAPAALATAAVLGSKRPRLVREHPRLFRSALAAAIGLGLLRWQLPRLSVETPRYVVEKRYGAFELRCYPPAVMAETHVSSAGFDAALNEGFRRLAAYIFGANTRTESVARTSPVLAAHEEKRRGERVAMTTPVTSRHDDSGYTVAFLMPVQHAREGLPQPVDQRVVLRSSPGRRVATLRCRPYGEAATRAEEARLLRLVRMAGLEPAGPVCFAAYDPRSTLPFLRRNEVWVEVGG